MKFAFSVTLSASTPRCSTTIFFTRSPISLIASPSYPCIWLDRSTPPSHSVELVVATGGITCSRVGPMIGPRLVPAKPRFGYHTSKALTSTRSYPLATREPQSGGCESRLEPDHAAIDFQRLSGDIASLV